MQWPEVEQIIGVKIMSLKKMLEAGWFASELSHLYPPVCYFYFNEWEYLSDLMCVGLCLVRWKATVREPICVFTLLHLLCQFYYVLPSMCNVSSHTENSSLLLLFQQFSETSTDQTVSSANMSVLAVCLWYLFSDDGNGI